jgi:L-ribulokinase
VPDPANVEAYDALYEEYRTLHDYFGRGTNSVMHRLKAIQRAAKPSFAAAAGQDAAGQAAAEPSAQQVSA